MKSLFSIWVCPPNSYFFRRCRKTNGKQNHDNCCIKFFWYKAAIIPIVKIIIWHIATKKASELKHSEASKINLGIVNYCTTNFLLEVPYSVITLMIYTPLVVNGTCTLSEFVSHPAHFRPITSYTSKPCMPSALICNPLFK